MVTYVTSPISKYRKPYTSVSEQVQLLARKGLNVGDRATAEAALRAYGYYRLSGYSHFFREHGEGAGGTLTLNAFVPNTSLSDVLNLYSFDDHLRGVLLKALATVEVALRFNIGHRLGRRDAFAHREPSHLSEEFTSWWYSGQPPLSQISKSSHHEWMDGYRVQERRSQEAFVLHFRRKYGPHLPVWVGTEVMSMGTLSRLYNGLHENDRKLIAIRFGVTTKEGEGDTNTLSNWLNHLRHVRNLCAHHGRVWNHTFDVKISIPPGMDELAHLEDPATGKIYGTIAILRQLIARMNPNFDWHGHVDELVDTLEDSTGISPQWMGFPTDWKSQVLWQTDYSADDLTLAILNSVDEIDVVNAKEARDLLTSRNPYSERRSWLRYLQGNFALIAHKLGPQTYFPSFQFEDGDVRQDVADVNEKLFLAIDENRRKSSLSHTQVQRWWLEVDETNGFSVPPIKQLETDAGSVLQAAKGVDF